MEAEQSKRSILKTITWRITASLDTFVIAWIITGDWKMGGSIAGIEIISKLFFYYFLFADDIYLSLEFPQILLENRHLVALSLNPFQ